MKTFLKKYWSVILLIIILIVISVLSFVPGKYLLSNDNYSPELNPGLTLLRSIISPAWRSYRVLGFASDSEQADIFRTGLMGLLSLITGKSNIGQIYYFICLSVGSLAMGFLVREMFNISKLKKYSNLALLLSGIIYISTLWTVWTFYQSMAPYITNFGFLPLLLYCIYRYIKDSTSKNALWLFLASLLFTAISVIATLFVVDFVFILAFVIFWSIYFGKAEKIVLKKILRTLAIFLTTQLFWILPFIFYTFSSSNDIVGSYVNRSITSSVIDLESQMQTAINTARFYSRILTDSNGSDFLYPISQDYLQYDFYKVISLIPAFFALVGLVFAAIKKNKKFVFFFIFILGTWFLIKTINDPFGGIFTFLQNNLPLFKQVFRWPSSKLYEVFLIALDICAVFGFMYFALFLMSFFKRKKVKIAILSSLVVLTFGLTISYMEYVFTGNMFAKKALVDLPNEYLDLQKYLEQNDTSGRIYYAPPSNENYFRSYTWGFRGSQFISYLLPNPVMDLSSAVGSSYGENAMNEMAQVFKSGDSSSFTNLLQKYEAKYLLVDRSLVAEGFTYDIDWKQSETIWKAYNSIWKKGQLELYEVPKSLTESVQETVANSSKESFVKEKSSAPFITPYLINANNWSFLNNFLVGSFIYHGGESMVSENISEIELGSLPTALKLNAGKLLLSPSYPQIQSNNYYVDPYKTLQDENYDYFSVKGKVFSNTQLQSGLTIENEFSDINNISGIRNEDFVSIDLTQLLSKSTGTNCGNSKNIVSTVNVTNQGIASGVSIEGSGDMSCVYSDISISPDLNYIAKVELNWEQGDKNSLPGFCLYSRNLDKCLNTEKFLISDSQYGERNVTIPVQISGDDSISLILYALKLGEKGDANIVFRKVVVSLASKFTDLNLLSESNVVIGQEIQLKEGKEYFIKIPVIYGDNSYVYNQGDKTNYMWQPNTEANGFDISWDNGMQSSVMEGYQNLSNNLLSTSPASEYLVFWNGQNITNIPSSLCLIYTGTSKCWTQKMLLPSETSSQLFRMISDSSLTNTLEGVVTNVSYKEESINTFKDFIIMRSPSQWNNISYSPLTETAFTQVEAQTIGSPSSSTFYKLQSPLSSDKTLLTIPQTESKGWVALTNHAKMLTDRVVVNGWKQGWDISNTDFNTIYIFYWPNLLGYLGYILIVVEFTYLLIKVFRKRTYAKQ